MRHHYNLIAQDTGPLVRDCPWYDASSIIKGQGLTYGATTKGAVLIDCSAQAADVIGVSNEAKTCSTTDITTGTLVFGKTILNPDAIYLAQYDNAEASDIDVVSCTTTAATLGTCDDDLDGSWLYANSGTGKGDLMYVGAASTTVFTFDTTTALDTAWTSSTDVLLIKKPWKYNDSVGADLSATFDELLSDEDSTGAIAILENYIEASTVAFGPLRPRQHHALSNLDEQNVKFYADIYFTDNAFMASSWT